MGINIVVPPKELVNKFEKKEVSTLANSPEDPDFPSQPLRDWNEEPTGSTYNFNPNKWYKVKVEWKDKDFRIWINDTLVWSVLDGPYDYAPIDFKIWLGSAPANSEKYRNLMPNIVYRNFRLVSYD